MLHAYVFIALIVIFQFQISMSVNYMTTDVMGTTWCATTPSEATIVTVYMASTAQMFLINAFVSTRGCCILVYIFLSLGDAIPIFKQVFVLFVW